MTHVYAEKWLYDLVDREQPGRWDVTQDVTFARPVDERHVSNYLADHCPGWAFLKNIRPKEAS